MPIHNCPKPRKNSYEWPCRVCHPKYYEHNPDIQWFILHVVGDVEPELKGPYLTEYGMEKAARRLKEQVGDEDGIYWLVQNKRRLDTGSWSGGFFMKGPDAED
jgi:hypothetical protein